MGTSELFALQSTFYVLQVLALSVWNTFAEMFYKNEESTMNVTTQVPGSGLFGFRFADKIFCIHKIEQILIKCVRFMVLETIAGLVIRMINKFNLKTTWILQLYIKNV